MSRFILILAIAAVGYIIYSLYLKNRKPLSKQQMIKLGLMVGGLFLILMAVTGRASIIFAAIGALMTAAMRYFPLIVRHWPQLRGLYNKHINSGGTAGRTSKVNTPLFVMTLDHDSGHMDAEITEGSFSGRHLSELSIDELQRFYRFCQTRDAQAVRVLESYIQRERIAEWQDAPNSGSQTAGNDKTSLDEAWEILGLQPGATKQDIIDAHRRLMSRMHPDKGGSNYLAAKINEAKKILLQTVA
ncbi:MAG: DnaJ domain-containing protein [Gammaproteobacteria bacterium]|nr:DnaJ domain-containing protein [Gammaproteobacteria bacterium]